MFAISSEQVGYILAGLATLVAGVERFANMKKAKKTEADQQQLSEAMMFKERGDLMLKQADEYKQLLEKEYLAHQTTREFHHAQASLAQVKLSECNEKNQVLQSKTDLTRIEEILIRQSNALTEVALGIKELIQRK